MPQSFRIAPGTLAESYEKALAALQQADAVAKLWRKDASLWNADVEHTQVIANRLGWIPVLDQMQAEAESLAAFAREISVAGLNDVVLLGMGGSSLAPEVFSLTVSAADPKMRFIVLDTTDPAALLEAEHAVDLSHALFIVASKSGKTIETLSQFRYFHRRMLDAGIRDPGGHFIAITDAGSYLDTLAVENKFLRIYRNPQDIGGRYSALSYFGLLPAAIWGIDVPAVLRAAFEARSACAPEAQPADNPGLHLGALLGAAAQNGSDKLALLASPRLAPLANWIEQLVAESTGKKEKGIVPVAGAVDLPIDVLASGCVNVALTLAGDDSARVSSVLATLEKRGVPVVEIRLAEAAQLGREFFQWEVATAIAGAVLAIDPFDEPNVQESKDATAAILKSFETSGAMPLGVPLLTDSGIELYYKGGAPAGDAAGPRLSEALRTFFASRKPDDYLALLAYVARDATNTVRLESIRADLAMRLNMPVLLGFGPRYMHSIGQLYKGGPVAGMFVVITATHAEDIVIPGAKYTFAQLEMAQALGDLESLDKRSKPALRIHLGRGASAGLADLAVAMRSALATQGATP